MIRKLLESSLRHMASAFGAYLVARGLIDQAMADTLPGFVMVVWAQLQSWFNAVDYSKSLKKPTVRYN